MKIANKSLGSIEKYIKDYLKGYKPYKTYWNYEDGCVLKGCMDMYHATENGNYEAFVQAYIDRFVMPDGSIPNYQKDWYNIDSINCGKVLGGLCWGSNKEYVSKAIEYHMQRLREHPRCACGNFMHHSVNAPSQIWLDGLYMALPFYMEYEMRFSQKKMENLGDIVSQFKNVRSLLFNEEKGLYIHAYDETRTQPWADKETGLSQNFWLRSNGWYLMALIDCIELCSEQIYEHYRALIDLFREAVRGILRWQDQETGLFYQVIDRADEPGNYLETSGSVMVAYAIMKGVRLGVLNDEKYLPIAKRMFESVCEHKLVPDEEGNMHLRDICLQAGFNQENRDGSVAYYLSEPRVCDDSKGVGPFMMAFAEYIRAN